MSFIKRIPRPLPLIEKIADMSYPALLTLWIAVVVVCSCIYYFMATLHPEHAPTHLADMEPLMRFLNSLYFSVTTATTTGYGDIVPMGISKLIASIESITAFLVFGIFLAKLSAQHAVSVAEQK
jgi:hypothetical protein